MSPFEVERFGLFTIIVHRQVIVVVVHGITEHQHLSLPVGCAVAIGMLLLIGAVA